MKLFSGKGSKQYWKAVNKATRRTVGIDIIYEYGCKAQEIEDENIELKAQIHRLEEVLKNYGCCPQRIERLKNESQS